MKLKAELPLPIFSPTEEFERLYVRPKPGRTLVVGSYIVDGRPDRRALYPDVLGVDMRDGPGVDLVANLENENVGSFSHIDCISALEHSPRPWLLAANIEGMMNSGSTIYLSVPFVWNLHAHPSDYFRFSADAIKALFPLVNWSALKYASDRLDDGVKTVRKIIDGHIYISRTQVLGFGVRV